MLAEMPYIMQMEKGEVSHTMLAQRMARKKRWQGKKLEN